MDQAAKEAVRCKKCLGSLRYLWRSAKTSSHHAAVAEMKQVLVESPNQAARKSSRADGSEVGSDDERFCDSGSEGGGEPEPLGDVEDSQADCAAGAAAAEVEVLQSQESEQCESDTRLKFAPILLVLFPSSFGTPPRIEPQSMARLAD